LTILKQPAAIRIESITNDLADPQPSVHSNHMGYGPQNDVADYRAIRFRKVRGFFHMLPTLPRA